MTTARRSKKSAAAERHDSGLTAKLEHVFLAGLGALSNAQQAGAKTFESLVKDGEEFQRQASKKTETLISDVQDSIRNMAGDATGSATGLIDKMRDASSMDKFQGVFDKRVADAMDRMNVPSKNDIDAINRKLNKIIRLLDEPKKPAAKKKTRKAATKKTATRKAATKKTATRKKAAKKTGKTSK